MKITNAMIEVEEYEMFKREWKLNHPKQQLPNVKDWNKYFRVKWKFGRNIENSKKKVTLNSRGIKKPRQ